VRLLLFFLPLSLLLAACGGSSSPSAGGGPVLQTIQISEKEYSLSPGTVTVSKTGTYEFKVTTDNGTIAHALEVERERRRGENWRCPARRQCHATGHAHQGRLVQDVLPDRRPQERGHARHDHRGERVGRRWNDDQRSRDCDQRTYGY
jgi:hypothetical protein